MIDAILIKELKSKLSINDLLDLYNAIFDQIEVAKLINDPLMGCVSLIGTCPKCNVGTSLKMIIENGVIMLNTECCDAIFAFPHPITIQTLTESPLGEIRWLNTTS